MVKYAGFSSYNDWAEAQNVHLKEQSDFADRLAASDIPSTPEVIVEIIQSHCISAFDDHELNDLAEALTRPIRFAIHKSKELGYRNGDYAARRAITQRLGLGQLKYEDP